jgi:hypothetical protein
MAYHADIKQGGWVYILEAVGSGWVKIGHSVSPITRTDGFQTGCPHPLRVRACFWAEDQVALEKELHELCKEHRGVGEWFSVDSPIIRRLMNAAHFASSAPADKRTIDRLEEENRRVRMLLAVESRRSQELMERLDQVDAVPF